MTLDNKEQKKIILQMLQITQFQGKDIDLIHKFKHAVETAEILNTKPENIPIGGL